MKEIYIFTDGGCSGNPGIGAWAFYVPDYNIKKTGFSSYTTNNKMELEAVIHALNWAYNTFYSQLKKDDVNQNILNENPLIIIFSDSKYVLQGISNWIKTWKMKNWVNSTQKTVKNKELWQKLDDLSQKLKIKWEWVKGHADNTGNQMAHSLVENMIKKHKV